jgi:hypothetical protein
MDRRGFPAALQSLVPQCSVGSRKDDLSRALNGLMRRTLAPEVRCLSASQILAFTAPPRARYPLASRRQPPPII